MSGSGVVRDPLRPGVLPLAHLRRRGGAWDFPSVLGIGALGGVAANSSSHGQIGTGRGVEAFEYLLAC